MLIAAAILIGALGLAHSYLGERYIIVRLLRRDDLPEVLGDRWFTGRTIRFAWHLTTVLAVGVAVVLVQVAIGAPDAAIVAAIGWMLIAAGLLPLLYTRGRHLAWLVLFASGALCLLWAAGIGA